MQTIIVYGSNYVTITGQLSFDPEQKKQIKNSSSSRLFKWLVDASVSEDEEKQVKSEAAHGSVGGNSEHRERRAEVS